MMPISDASRPTDRDALTNRVLEVHLCSVIAQNGAEP